MLFLALKHLRQRKRQTIVTTLGVFFGSISFVVVSGYTLGLESFFKDRLLDNDGHLRISTKESYIESEKLSRDLFAKENVKWLNQPSGRKDSTRIIDPIGWYDRLSKDSQVESFAPQFISQVIVSRSTGASSAVLVGIRPSLQLQVTPRLEKSILKGSVSEIESGGNRVVLGSGLAQKLGVSVGDTVKIVGQSGNSQPFKVVGIFAIGLEQFDSSYAYANISDVQRLTANLSKVNEIVVRLKDREMADAFVIQYKQIGIDKVRSWKEINSTFVAIIGIQTGLRFLVVGILSLVISFSIFNILNISVTQKKKDVAILRAIGFSKQQIILLFLYQGLIIGFIGGLLGLPVGYSICVKLSQIQFSEAAGNISISFSPLIYIFSFLIGVVSTTLAGYLPSRSAGKLEPIQIIREGTD